MVKDNPSLHSVITSISSRNSHYFLCEIWLKNRKFLNSIDITLKKSISGYKHKYNNEIDLWNDVLNDKLYQKARLSLNKFRLLEWIPQAPGLYHTSEAKYSRTMSKNNHRIEIEDKSVIYDIYGKEGNIKGGYGCLRLSSKIVGNEELYFLCATSSGVAHRGFVIAMRGDLYEQVNEIIKDSGGVCCNIYGEIRIFPRDDSIPAYFKNETSRFYLFAHKLSDIDPEPGTLTGTASVAFEGNVDNKTGIFFTYCHFNPAKSNSIRDCAKWIETNYVQPLYDGKVLTDFDEEKEHFSSVVFPVNYLMEPNPSKKHISRLNELLTKLCHDDGVAYNISFGYVMGDVIGVGNSGNNNVIAKNIQDPKNNYKISESNAKILEIESSNVYALKHRSEILFAQKEFDDAINICNKIIDLLKSHEDTQDLYHYLYPPRYATILIESYKMKAIILFEKERFEEAIGTVFKAVEIFPKLAKEWIRKEIKINDTKKYNEVLRTYDKFIYDNIQPYNNEIRKNPNNADAWCRKGYHLEWLGMHNESIECYDKAIEINHNSGEAWYSKSRIYNDLKQFDNAIECYDKAIEIYPHNDSLWVHKGNAFNSKGQYDKAIECYDKCYGYTLQFHDGWYNLGFALYNLKKYDKSIGCFDMALNFNTNIKFDDALMYKKLAQKELEKRKGN